MIDLRLGNTIDVLREMPDELVQCVITSPPYWGLRDYGIDGQIGLERTPEEYVSNMVAVMRECWQVMRDDGTLWLNLGDSYWGGKGKSGYELPHEAEERRAEGKTFQTAHNVPGYMEMRPSDGKHPTIKPKDLVGIPWRVAFALQQDGWYLRSDIIWHKPNPMPESVTDRPTKAHEYVFLMAKSQKYYYDAEAIKERYTGPINRWGGQKQTSDTRKGRAYRDMQHLSSSSALQPGADLRPDPEGRNKRSVWTVPTQPYKGAHFATFPEKLIEPCVLAGSRKGDTILDPFCGSGTTGVVATRHGRNFIGIDLKQEYLDMAQERIAKAQPMLVLEASG